jgi:hypothetical protein
VKSWKIANHPHTIVGCRRGFEVRVYHDPDWSEPYFVTVIETEHGWIMDAIDILAGMDGGSSPIGRA